MSFLDRCRRLASRVDIAVLDKKFDVTVEPDMRDPRPDARVFVQISYSCRDLQGMDRETKQWKGRKWYLSEFMTDDEVIKTIYLATETCVRHEIMEGFKIDGAVLFNPHVDFEELLRVSNRQVTREQLQK